MKLKPRQIIGLIAIVLFGGILISQLTQPTEREIMERRLASLPQMPSPDEAPLGTARPSPPAPAAVSASAAVPASDPGAVPVIPIEPDDSMPGSQEAKDNLYCWAVLNAEFDVRIKTDPGKATPLLDAAKRLEAAGVAKLEAEGVTNRDNWASLTVSYAEKARADYRRNALRIPVAACSERASNTSPNDRP
jgi:hypothetical protein